MILAIDPGSEKCGIALFDETGRLSEKKVIAVAAIIDQIRETQPATIVIGESFFGRRLAKLISGQKIKTEIKFVSEKDSTWLARKKYWRENSPKGFWKIIPTSLRTPPVPVDDYAAVIIGERYLKFLLS